MLKNTCCVIELSFLLLFQNNYILLNTNSVIVYSLKFSMFLKLKIFIYTFHHSALKSFEWKTKCRHSVNVTTTNSSIISTLFRYYLHLNSIYLYSWTYLVSKYFVINEKCRGDLIFLMRSVEWRAKQYYFTIFSRKGIFLA